MVRDNFHGGQEKANETGQEFCTKEGIGYMVTYCITVKTGGKDPVYGSRLIIGTDTRKNGEDSRITLNF